MPTLIAHGALISAKLLANATLKIYNGRPHGLAAIRPQELNDDLHDYVRAGSRHAYAVVRGARDSLKGSHRHDSRHTCREASSRQC